MGIRIHQLSSLIANQIAAGEVIERPASVVKELLENALDAQATHIIIDIGYGGLNQIKVSDNGIGIDADDLLLAIAPHATSKISSLDDLYSIASMGFRGEALASIASISKLTLTSKPKTQKHAMSVMVRETQVQLVAAAHNVGTTVSVSDLFYNTPVRKRFLKSAALEFQAIEKVVRCFALSASDIALTLIHDGKQILVLPQATSAQAKQHRMGKLFGAAFIKDAIYIDAKAGGLQLLGWISGSKMQRSQNDRQWIYVNQRMVKDKLIYHAIKQAYEGIIHPGRFPTCVLDFFIDTKEVDVNVHPTKHEVRFQQPRLVHDFLNSQIAKALKSQAIELKPEYEEKKYDLMTGELWSAQEPKAYYSGVNKPWVILNASYILTFIKEEPYIVDVINLQKRCLYQQLRQMTLPLKSRPLLVPVTEKIGSIEPELQAYLTQLGIQVECFKTDELKIVSIPLCMPYLDLGLFLKEIEQLKHFKLEQLFDLLCQCQVFSSSLFNTEEQEELNQFLIREQESEAKALFRALTVEQCRKMLHATV